MIGPDDLSQDLGVPGEMQEPALLDAYERDFRHLPQAQGAVRVERPEPGNGREWVSKGCTWIPYQNDAAMVLNAARAAVPKLMEIGGRV